MIWSAQIEALLQARGVWQYVETSIALPDRAAANYAEVSKGRNMARAAIICSLEAEYISMVATERDPKSMWDKLAAANKSKCAAAAHTLRSRLLSMRMAEGTSIRSFVNEICAIERKLLFAGKAIDEDDKKFALLNGLLPAYIVKKTILQEKTEMAFESMVSSLEHTEDELAASGRKGSGSSIGSAFITGGQRGNRSGCWVCGKSGHRMGNCFFNPKSRNYKPSYKRTPEIESNLRKRKLLNSHTEKRGEECEFAFMTLPANNILRRWFLDSCSSRHLCNQRDHMFDYRALSKAEYVSAACEGGQVRVVGIGNIRVRQIINGQENITLLKDVGYAPKCRTNLVAMGKAQRAGVNINFPAGSTKFMATHQGKLVMIGDSATTGITELTDMAPVHIGQPAVTFFSAGENDAMQLAHRRTCHTSVSTLRKMERSGAVHGLEATKSTKQIGQVCEACVEGKATNNAHTRRSKSSKAPLELMHTDLTGPITPEGLNGEKHAQLLVDDYSGAIWVSTMKAKSGATEGTKQMVLHAQKLTGRKVITIRPDGAKELTEGQTKKFLDENGTLIDPIPPYSPQSNGRAERSNRTIYEKARTVLAELNMMCTFDGYKKLWPEALRCVVYVYNRTLTKATNANECLKTPYEIITGDKPDLSNLRIFGTHVKVLKPKEYRKSKVGSKTWDGIHVGYNPGDAYRAYIPSLGRVFVSKDVTFIEKLYKRQQMVAFDIAEESENSESEEDDNNSHDEKESDRGNDSLPWIPKKNNDDADDNAAEKSDDDSDEEYQDASTDATGGNVQKSVSFQRKSGRKTKPPNRYGGKANLAFLTAEAMSGNVDGDVPSSAEGAIRSADKSEWVSSMADEINSLVDNKVFDVVEIPKDRKIVKCRWVYALKRNSSGAIIRYKSRVVAKGYSQIQGVDYDEVFSPVVKFETLRFLLAHVAKHDLELKQLDVKTAFLYGELDEEIYMELPIIPDEVMAKLTKASNRHGAAVITALRKATNTEKGKYVLRLQKSLYGLRQAAKQWNVKLKGVLEGRGLTQSDSDPCLYIMMDNTGARIFILVYVDDIIMAAKKLGQCEYIRIALKDKFELSEMDDAHFFLGIKITRDRAKGKLTISQLSYIQKLLSRFNLDGGIAKLPMRGDLHLEKALPDEHKRAIELPYRELLGSLMYLACTSRPDIMFAVAKLARYFACWGNQHWTAAKKVAKYIASTKTLVLEYGNSDDGIIGYTDADWAGDKEERKSTGGFVYLIGGTAFAWSSKRQSVVAASSLEAEYISQARTVREGLWIRKLQMDFGIDDTPILIRADNQGAISLARDYKASAATKHIATAYHLTRDYVAKKLVKLEYIPSVQMVADGLTKALGRIKHEANCVMYGMVVMNTDDGSCREGVLA